MAEFSDPLLSPDDRLLLACSAVEPDESQKERIRADLGTIEDWDLLLRRAHRHRIAPLLRHNLERAGALSEVPQPVQTYLHDFYVKNIARNERIWFELTPLLDALDREGIEFLALKGLLLALTVYDDLKLRSLGVDVDLLFRKADLSRLEGILREMGFGMTSVLKRKDIERQLQVEGLTLRYRSPHGVILEAHSDLTPFLAENRIDTEKVFDRAMAFEARGRTLHALSPGDLISHLCLHLHKHFSLQGAPLIWWCDLAESIKGFGARIDGSTIRSELSSQSAFETVSGVLDVAHRWLSTPALKGFKPSEKSETQDIEARLLRDLKEGPRERVCVPESFIRRLGRSEGIGKALKALWLDLFPSPEFMMFRYRLRWKPLAFLFYPLRWIDALRLEIKRMVQRKR